MYVVSVDAYEVSLMDGLQTIEISMRVEFKSKKYWFRYIHQPTTITDSTIEEANK